MTGDIQDNDKYIHIRQREIYFASDFVGYPIINFVAFPRFTK